MSTLWQRSTDMASLGYQLVSEQPSYDPDSGTAWLQTYHGQSDAIATLANALAIAGARVRWEQKAGANELQALWARNPNVSEASEVASDSWSLVQEPYQIPLFRHPLAALESESYISGSFAQYRKDIQDAVDAGTAYPLSTSIFPVGQHIYFLLGQGVEYWETQRPILSRNRVFSKTYPTRQVIRWTSDVYRRATLIGAPAGFNIPAAVQAQIPVDPSYSPPSGTQWGWRMRQQSSEYVTTTGKWQEQMEWEFGWWYSALYNITQ